jgi:hypothetical protein
MSITRIVNQRDSVRVYYTDRYAPCVIRKCGCPLRCHLGDLRQSVQQAGDLRVRQTPDGWEHAWLGRDGVWYARSPEPTERRALERAIGLP